MQYANEAHLEHECVDLGAHVGHGHLAALDHREKEVEEGQTTPLRLELLDACHYSNPLPKPGTHRRRA